MKDYVITKASSADAAAIAEAENAVFADAWSLSSVFDFLSSPLSRSVVAKDRAGNLIAYCLFQWIAPEGEILRIATLPAYRRQGIGKALLDALLSILDGISELTLYLEVRSRNASAIALYESFGFVITERRKNYYRDPTDDALLMRRVGR